MVEPKTGNFEGWCLVEMFGHAKEVGFVTTEAYGSAVLFRCDTPELPEAARRAIESIIRRPLIILELPKTEVKQLLPGEVQDRTFPCCGGNPEDGHREDCPQEEDDEEEEYSEERSPF